MVITDKYVAFISYSSKDKNWAKWFHEELENYRVPPSLRKHAVLNESFFPVFWDLDELKAGNLSEQIYTALEKTTYLIVICSPNAVKSKWVNKEIRDFIKIGTLKGIDNIRNIFPFIVDGCPCAKNKEDECFPKALRDLPQNRQQLGGNIKDTGLDKAFVKVVAGMLPNVGFDELWNRYKRKKLAEKRKKREERDRFLSAQSRFVSKRANDIAKKGSYLAMLLALEILPKDLTKPDRPYTPEAEALLREACNHNTATIHCHNQAITCVDCSPDGQYLATASRDKTVKIWDIESGALLSTFNGHTSKVNSVFYNPQGDMIVTASADKTVRIWDAVSAKELKVFKGHSLSVNSAVFSPDGKFVASGSEDCTVHLWDVESWNEVKTIYGNLDDVHSVAFSPDGKRLLTASRDTSVRIFDIDTEKEVFHVGGPKLDMALTASYSPDGNKVLSVSFNKAVHVWDVYSRAELLRIQESCFFATFTPDGRQIVTSNMSFYDSETGRRIKTGELLGVEYITFCSNKHYMISALNNGLISVYKYYAIDKPRMFYVLQQCNLVIFSPDVNYFAIDTFGSNVIRVLDVRYEKDPIFLIGHSQSISTIAYSPDGKLLVSASYDKTIRIWDVKSCREVKVLIGHQDCVYSAFFSPDSNLVISSSADNTIRIWNVNSGIEEESMRKYHNDVCQAIISNDGIHVLSESLDNRIMIWDLYLDTPIKFLDGYEDGLSAFSPDGRQFASALANDNTIHIVDIDSGKELHVLAGHNDMIGHLAFSSNGKYLLSSSKCLKVWDIVSGKELQCFDDECYRASFSNDMKYIIGRSSDGETIKIWEFPPLQELIDQTRERFKDRQLTIDEKKQYGLL